MPGVAATDFRVMSRGMIMEIQMDRRHGNKGVDGNARRRRAHHPGRTLPGIITVRAVAVIKFVLGIINVIVLDILSSSVRPGITIGGAVLHISHATSE